MTTPAKFSQEQFDAEALAFLAMIEGADKTRQTYRDALRAFARWWSDQPQTLSAETIKIYGKWLKERNTANTVSTYLVGLRRFFDHCVEQNILSNNPAASVRGARKPRGHLRHDLSRTDLRLLFDQIDRNTLPGLRDDAMINLMVRNGLRVVEVVRANVGDLEHVQGRTILRVLGKGRDARDEFVVLSALTRKIIDTYLDASHATKNDDPLFTSLGLRNHGGRLSTRTVHRRVTNYMKSAGIKTDKISPHSLRHSFVTLAIEGGATLVEAQAAARHRSVQTTMVYFHEHGRLHNPIEDRIQI